MRITTRIKYFFILAFTIWMNLSYGQLTSTLSIASIGGGLPPGDIDLPITVEAIDGGDNFGTFQFFFEFDPTVFPALWPPVQTPILTKE